LCESEAQKLIQAGKLCDFAIAVIPRNTTAERVHGQKTHDLGENCLFDWHGSFLAKVRFWKNPIVFSISITTKTTSNLFTCNMLHAIQKTLTGQ
jgi:hypothetical protein